MDGIRKIVKTEEEAKVAIAIYKDLGIKEHRIMEKLDEEFPEFAAQYRQYAGKAKLEYYVKHVQELEAFLTELNTVAHEHQN